MADFSQSKLIQISSSPIKNKDFFKIYYKSVSIKEIQSKEDFTYKNKLTSLTFLRMSLGNDECILSLLKMINEIC